MVFYGQTDIGKRRQQNEDSYYIKDEGNYKLFVVADGMGGYAGGEVASKLAIKIFTKFVESNLSLKKHYEREDIVEILKQGIINANTSVHEKAQNNENFKNMGTTIAIALIYNSKVYIAHVGDSRIYRVRKNIIRQLTKDHSYVEKLISEGTITRREADNHPKKNMLTRAIGAEETVESNIKVKGMLPGDIFVLCTDGLTNMVQDKEIFKTVCENEHNLKNACDQLINNANFAGGYDNSTVILIGNY